MYVIIFERDVPEGFEEVNVDIHSSCLEDVLCKVTNQYNCVNFPELVVGSTEFMVNGVRESEGGYVLDKYSEYDYFFTVSKASYITG